MAMKPHNHWTESGDLVIEERTLFRQVGWHGHNNDAFYGLGAQNLCKSHNPGGYSPVYEHIATWKEEAEGWVD